MLIRSIGHAIAIGVVLLGSRVLSALPAEAKFVSRAPLHLRADTLDFIHHLSRPVSNDDAICWDTYFAATAPYKAGRSDWMFAAYSQEVSLFNLANLNARKRTFTGDATYIVGAGWRCDGVNCIGSTGVSPSTDPNIRLNNVGMNVYLWDSASQTPNPAVGINSGGAILSIGGYTGVQQAIKLNVNTATLINTFYGQGDFAGDRLDDATNVLWTKDAMQGTVVSPSTGVPSGSLQIFKDGSAFGQLTVAEYDVGAGMAAPDRAKWVLATTEMLGCLGDLPRPPDPPEPALPAFFDPKAAAGLAPLMILRSGNPPASNSVDHTSYIYGPLSTARSSGIPHLNSSTWTSSNPGQEFMISIWGNRQQGMSGKAFLKFNNLNAPPIKDSSGIAVGTEYTTVAKANAATEAAILHAVGASSGVWERPLVRSGICAVFPCTDIEAVPWTTANADPATYFPHTAQNRKGHVAHDAFIIPPESYISNGKAFALAIDYEVDDLRPCLGTGSTDEFIAHIAQEIHGYGKKLVVLTDPWDSGVSARNGFCLEAMNHIVANVDWLNNTLSSKNNSGSISQEFYNGLTFMAGVSGVLDRNKVLVSYLTGGTTEADTLTIHNLQLTTPVAGYDVVAYYAIQGQAAQCTSNSSNKKLSLLLWGHCP
jgi:hypothetical protein